MILKVLTTLLLSLAIFSCGAQSPSSDKLSKEKEDAYIKSITKLSGNLNSNIVVIDLQGGPQIDFEDVDYSVYPDLNKDIVKFKKSLFVAVHQSQTLHPELFKSKDITFEQAKKYASESSQMVVDVIQYYKKQGKTVFLIGTSYGAFVAADTILKIYENKLIQADKYIIFVGRLDMPDLVWKTFSKGGSMLFKDGLTPYSDEKEQKALLSEKKQVTQRNMNRLAAGLGYKRYTKLLANAPLDNVTYYYGEKDIHVGQLSKEEVSFLRSKKANVFMAKNADHFQTQRAMPQAVGILMKGIK